jgi:hypothetical protein
MIRIAILTSLALTAVACSDDPKPVVTPDANPGPGPDTVLVEGDIAASTTWTAAKPYVLAKNTPIFVKPGVTLTIEPGTEIRGQQGSLLVISRGAKILAQGRADKPIVLTSSQAVGMRTPGWWGGLLVLGAAPINTGVRSTPPTTDVLFEAFPNSRGAEGKFGGTDPADNSGIIRYVRIEFAGYNFVDSREFNSLTLCGVGTGTEIDYVQVHKGSDDGVELFGGTVNLKHLVASQNEDDGFDTDNGWNGKAQFIVVQNVSHPATLPEASNGYESDNHATAASYTAEPRTLPTVSNVTLIGDRDWAGGANWAAVFRRGTGGRYYNHIWLNFQRGPEVRDAETAAQITAGNLQVINSILFGNGAPADNNLAPPPPAAGASPEDETLLFNAASKARLGLDPGLPAAATSKTAPDWKPVAGAAALAAENAGAPPADPFFDATATFVGAIGAVDWTTGWTKYPQN